MDVHVLFLGSTICGCFQKAIGAGDKASQKCTGKEASQRPKMLALNGDRAGHTSPKPGQRTAPSRSATDASNDHVTEEMSVKTELSHATDSAQEMLDIQQNLEAATAPVKTEPVDDDPSAGQSPPASGEFGEESGPESPGSPGPSDSSPSDESLYETSDSDDDDPTYTPKMVSLIFWHNTLASREISEPKLSSKRCSVDLRQS